MKTILHAYVMCQSMFLAIPCPIKIWDEEAKDKMLLFLPIIGLEIGAIWAALAAVCSFLKLPVLIKSLLLCAYPYIITGFIHLDGFMDVTDAVRSCRSLEKRLEILKDPHVGSFSVINVILLILAQFSIFASVHSYANHIILIFIPAISRCFSSLAITSLKPMSTSQYANHKKPKAHLIILSAMLCIFLLASVIVCKKYSLACIGCLIGYVFALLKAYKSLGGMNGDVSGYALTIGELCALAVYALI